MRLICNGVPHVTVVDSYTIPYGEIRALTNRFENDLDLRIHYENGEYVSHCIYNKLGSPVDVDIFPALFVLQLAAKVNELVQTRKFPEVPAHSI